MLEDFRRRIQLELENHEDLRRELAQVIRELELEELHDHELVRELKALTVAL